MARAKYIKAARKDYPEFGIKKGDGYYMWSFRFGPTMKSKTAPKRSQLTRSGFLSALYDLEDEIAATSNIDKSQIDSWVSDIQNLRDECESSLDNMPESLKEGSSSGQLLQERLDGLESWIADLENVDAEIDEEALMAEAEDEVAPDADSREDEVQNLYEEKLEARYDEIKDAVENANPGLN